MCQIVAWMQVLRYDRGGKPLWVTDYNILQNSSAVPDCEKCGAPRHFEFQVNCTHTHLFNGPFSGTTRVSRYQKAKTDLDFTEARDSEWQWHQLGHVQVCTSIQTDNHASTPPLKFFTGRMPFLPPNQQRPSTEGKNCIIRA